jgi:signal transduction histidine kinase
LIKTASGISESSIGTRLVLPERKDELYELTETINDLLVRIEKSMQQQKQFTSDASHEIRTPLAGIRGTLEVLLRKHREPQVYETKLNDVISQVDRLDVLLDQLLQLARIESGITIAKKESILLLNKIISISEKWHKELLDKKIKLEIHIPEETRVLGDAFYFELIFDNLLSNAIKYSLEKGTIVVSWNSNLKTLCIQDDGLGISAEQLPNIFNRFYRTDASRSSTIKGNGLGLSIAKKLADLQNIALSASSTLEKGTAFTLQF